MQRRLIRRSPGGEPAPIEIEDEDAAFTFKRVGTPGVGWFSAQPLFDVLAEEIGDAYLQ